MCIRACDPRRYPAWHRAPREAAARGAGAGAPAPREPAATNYSRLGNLPPSARVCVP
ncbi:hypothetical protein GCM10010413_05940 [Promicromonospora sukumoe]